MIFPEDFEEKIGFSAVKSKLKEYCISRIGRNNVDLMKFLTNPGEIKMRLEQCHEFLFMLRSNIGFPLDEFEDIRKLLKRLETPGTFLEQESLFEFIRAYSIAIDCCNFFSGDNHEKYPELTKLSRSVEVNKSLISEAEKIMDVRGNIKDSASTALHRIRSQIFQKESALDRTAKEILKQAKKANTIPSDVELTVRNSRLVIPVEASNKKAIKGFIQDESSSGQTLFIEPEPLLMINNEIRELKYAEKREIVKILVAYAELLRVELDSIFRVYLFLGLLDIAKAKARFAMDTNSFMPKIENCPRIGWYKARHPLLVLFHQTEDKKVVSQDISIDKDRILVISGPNAGGKSVCLKTVGLLQYMLQTGMLVPAADYSEAGIFKKIFIDIGDEQSIENSLSSYSSHLLRMNYFVRNADQDTLFLIDEFGKGTEPTLGGAIAQAILQELNKKKSMGVINTHYANLKEFAKKTDGLINGAMLYDSKKLEPLYTLKIGIPGSSFAFEIARKTGLPDNILRLARAYAGKKYVDFEKQFQDLENEKIELQKKDEQLKVADSFLSEMIEKYQGSFQNIENRKKEIIKEAQKEAQQIIANANRTVERVIKEIKESQADKKTTFNLRNHLKDVEKSFSKTKVKDIRDVKPKENLRKDREKVNKSIEEGMKVRMSGKDDIGVVELIKDHQAWVAFDRLKMILPLSSLELVEENKTSNERKASVKYQMDLGEKAGQFKTKLDIRGRQYEDANEMIFKFIDEATLLGYKELRILHGKGSGILRNLSREIAAKHPDVSSYADERLEAGGHGITIIRLK